MANPTAPPRTPRTNAGPLTSLMWTARTTRSAASTGTCAARILDDRHAINYNFGLFLGVKMFAFMGLVRMATLFEKGQRRSRRRRRHRRTTRVQVQLLDDIHLMEASVRLSVVVEEVLAEVRGRTAGARAATTSTVPIAACAVLMVAVTVV